MFLLQNVVPKDYLLLIVKAMDNDTGVNGKISYYLQVNDKNVEKTEDFQIDSETGELRTNRQLLRKEQSRCVLFTNCYNLFQKI